MPLLTTMSGCPFSVLGGGFTGLKGLARNAGGGVIANQTVEILNASFVPIFSTAVDGVGAFHFTNATSGSPRYLSIVGMAGVYDLYGPFTITVPQDLGITTFPDPP